MRTTIKIDSASHEEAHDFVAAFQRTRHHGLPGQITTEPVVSIQGPSSWTVTTPALYPDHASALLREFDGLTQTRTELASGRIRTLHDVG
jgi:hypothetical protein